MISYICFNFNRKLVHIFQAHASCAVCAYTMSRQHYWQSPLSIFNGSLHWMKSFYDGDVSCLQDIWTGWYNCLLKAWQRNIQVKHGDTRIHNVSKTHTLNFKKTKMSEQRTTQIKPQIIILANKNSMYKIGWIKEKLKKKKREKK